MKLSAPKNITWIIAVVLAALALLGKLVALSFITTYGFWILLIAFVLLAIANFIKGL